MKKWGRELIWWFGTICLMLLGLCATPFLYVWLLIDSRRLKRVATDIEPLPDTPPPHSSGLIMRLLIWFLDHVAQPVIIFFGLPLIVIVGMFIAIFDRDNVEDDE